jgi:phosphatidylglycerophosphatase A
MNAWPPVRKFVIKALASGFYLSYLPAYLLRSKRYTGAGLVGSLWAVAAIPWLPTVGGRQIAVWLGAVAIALVISDEAEVLLDRKDDPRIVIDEFVGYWTAILLLHRTPAMLISAFVLFRIMDVVKPLGIRRLGDLPGGWGVVFDDLAAGLAANLLLQLMRCFYSF